MSSIADSLSPAELDMVTKAFGFGVLEESSWTPSLMEEIEWLVGLTTGQHLWDAMWRFGIVIDNDTMESAESLTGYWNPEGSIHNRAGYYVPCDYDTEIPMVSLDTPPINGAAWDSKGV
jgi:hypothetical protein